MTGTIRQKGGSRTGPRHGYQIMLLARCATGRNVVMPCAWNGLTAKGDWSPVNATGRELSRIGGVPLRSYAALDT